MKSARHTRQSAPAELEERIGYRFRDRSLFLCAMTHSSYINEHDGTCYERLEFLGDAVLELISSDREQHYLTLLIYRPQEEAAMTALKGCSPVMWQRTSVRPRLYHARYSPLISQSVMVTFSLSQSASLLFRSEFFISTLRLY